MGLTMIITQGMKQTPRWPRLIKQLRLKLKESQADFGNRFGVSHAAVSDWENGKSEAPYTVTWWLYTIEQARFTRLAERGKGDANKEAS